MQVQDHPISHLNVGGSTFAFLRDMVRATTVGEVMAKSEAELVHLQRRGHFEPDVVNEIKAALAENGLSLASD